MEIVCPMAGPIIRVLIVDDYEPWRRFIRLTLLAYEKLQVIGEVSDGLEAVHQAHQLQPELILLDIGLPELNGIEAARRIREVSPTSKILFVSENRDWDIVKEALRVGGSGYVVKSSAANELLAAIWAVLAGEQFLSAGLADRSLTDPEERNTANIFSRNRTIAAPVQEGVIARHHKVGFYSHDRDLLDALTQFIGAALNVGNAAIVIATESHRNRLLVSLQKYGLNVVTAVEQGKYIAVDAAGALSTVMVDGKVDAVRFFTVFDDLIEKAEEAARGGQSRVAIFGESVHLLWAEGKAEAAIQMERLGNQLGKRYDVDILCAYSLTSFQGGMGSHIFEKVCAEHSAVHTW
jgi:DNA-binding NarL/FixJ family response regulator